MTTSAGLISRALFDEEKDLSNELYGSLSKTIGAARSESVKWNRALIFFQRLSGYLGISMIKTAQMLYGRDRPLGTNLDVFTACETAPGGEYFLPSSPKKTD